MVYDIFRDSLFGQTVRYLTGNKYFLYPEENPGFDLFRQHSRYGCNPGARDSQATVVNELGLKAVTDVEKPYPSTTSESPDQSQSWSRAPTPVLPDGARSGDEEHDIGMVDHRVSHNEFASNDWSEPPTPTNDSKPSKASKAAPVTADAEGNILVGWYGDDDPENPKNWSAGKKWILVILIFYYTFAVYGSAAIYTSSLEGVQEKFNIGPTTAELGLSIFVLGYGVGPLIWAPMSEIPRFGRNIPYLSTFLIFFALSFPTAVVNNFPGLVVLRFLQGFFGSPSLANGGASMHDLFREKTLPYFMAFW
ncbi:hypothetical protein KEM56_001846, partial [Ascosphaera pollenicola]